MDWIAQDKFLVHGRGINFINLSLPVRFSKGEVYCTLNGKKIGEEDDFPVGSVVHVVPRLPGGKGGFGSMLRAIGAQIEKTTNREACRDLSGRRLRDINEEKRLKNWINNKAELEKERKDKKRRKLEHMVQEPKIDFKDPNYEAARSDMTEKVADALEQGLKAASAGPSTAGTSGVKRPCEDKAANKKKKKKIWGMDDDDLSGSSDEDSEDDSSTRSSDDGQKSRSGDETVKTSDEEKSCDAASASKAAPQEVKAS